jgi:hypothetical protein
MAGVLYDDESVDYPQCGAGFSAFKGDATDGRRFSAGAGRSGAVMTQMTAFPREFFA